MLAAPFPYFGGKSRAADTVWAALGNVTNYVEPFFGSGANLLNSPTIAKVETVNDLDGFVANFWRAVASDPDAVTYWADWPTNENDLEARHGWLINRATRLRWSLEDPDFYDAKIAGWWCWGACNWIGSGWCEGRGPWQSNGANISKPHASAGQGINRKLPHVGNAGRGINRQLPHASAGRGDEHPRTAFIRDWMHALHRRLRDVRVMCGDWSRVLTESVTTRHGMTGVFLDPPYEKGEMQYAAGGVKTNLSASVRDWCKENELNPKLRIVLCGHDGEHDALGWQKRYWKARKGYAATDEAVANSKAETIWVSPACVPLESEQLIAR